MGVANVVVEACWLRNLLLEHRSLLNIATLVYCDNVSIVYLSCNPFKHQRTKHIEMDIYFVHDKVSLRHDRVLHVPYAYRYVDIFTKVLPRPFFWNF